HEPQGSPADWGYFADPAHTVVFYMGVARLPAIVARLGAAGAAPSHPVAIIERATLPDQRVVRGTLADIAARAADLGLAPPALLVAGAVARLGSAEVLGTLGQAPAGALA
ncbi:MAG TPA: SAM-dependent methyltransferase, partial [Steroidobacteraceae bacterium]|nr:SAM-dependent methyltransferase [Steroidobacteraceae bacterium]